MSISAYQRTAQRAETARETEYRLFGDVCRELTAIQRDDVPEIRKLEALDWNRSVWTTLMLDCAQPENRLPPELRAQIVSLGIWVYRHTEEAMWRGAEIQPLVEVNTALMQGLLGRFPQAS